MLNQLLCQRLHCSVQLLVLLIAGGALGCVSSSAADPHVPYRASSLDAATALRRTEPAPHDAALALFSLPALQNAALPDGDTELRASTGPSMLDPAMIVLRVVRIRGRVAGDVYLVWRAGTDSVAQRVEAKLLNARPCDPPRRNAQLSACRVRFETEPNWRNIDRTLDSLDIWRMPSAATMRAEFRTAEIELTDQPSVYLERRQGEMYSIDWYYGVHGYRGTPGVQLLAIYRFITDPTRR